MAVGSVLTARCQAGAWQTTNHVIAASATGHKMDASVDRVSIYISTSENYYTVNS